MYILNKIAWQEAPFEIFRDQHCAHSVHFGKDDGMDAL